MCLDLYTGDIITFCNWGAEAIRMQVDRLYVQMTIPDESAWVRG